MVHNFDIKNGVVLLNFDIKSRVVLVSILPVTGDITSMKQVRVLREALAFSDEENEEIKMIRDPNGGVTWDGESTITKDIAIAPVMNEVIVGLLTDINEKKQLTDNHIELWDMFMEVADDAKDE